MIETKRKEIRNLDFNFKRIFLILWHVEKRYPFPSWKGAQVGLAKFIPICPKFS